MPNLSGREIRRTPSRNLSLPIHASNIVMTAAPFWYEIGSNTIDNVVFGFDRLADAAARRDEGVGRP